MMSDLDGCLPKPILNQQLNNPSIILLLPANTVIIIINTVLYAVGLSVDWINNKIYYVDNNSGREHYIGVLDFTNNQFKKLITASTGNLQDIIVDPTTR